jgi:hypothetical protein
MRRWLGFTFPLAITLICSCRTLPEPAQRAVLESLIRPIDALRSDLEGHAPKAIVCRVYEFYQHFGHWPSDKIDILTFESPDCPTLPQIAYDEIECLQNDDGSCILRMKRKDYSETIRLAKP